MNRKTFQCFQTGIGLRGEIVRFALGAKRRHEPESLRLAVDARRSETECGEAGGESFGTEWGKRAVKMSHALEPAIMDLERNQGPPWP